jgi:hypothetical protein
LSNAGSQWFLLVPNSGSALPDSVSIFTAFRVEELQFVAVGLSGPGKELDSISPYDFSDALREVKQSILAGQVGIRASAKFESENFNRNI